MWIENLCTYVPQSGIETHAHIYIYEHLYTVGAGEREGGSGKRTRRGAAAGQRANKPFPPRSVPVVSLHLCGQPGSMSRVTHTYE